MQQLRHIIPLLFLAALSAQGAILTPSDCSGLRPSTTVCNFDPNSGLHWLDWTATTGRSYNEVSGLLGATQEFDGFRYATEDEVEALISFYTAVNTIEPSAEVLTGDPAFVMLIQDLGITRADGITITTRAFIAEEESPSRQHVARLDECITTAVTNCDVAGEVFALRAQASKGSTSTLRGHALVAAVPEPTSFTMLTLGLGCLIWRRIRR